ncbi:MAG: diguanylate cyclase (GGDEF)-like protein/PAS domain S-box-containing protein [Pseudohongiellaceae bacterium]|jgi:diguanylate cyclase (GGDEF)-like protein/PAS domain S-box-containing protein
MGLQLTKPALIATCALICGLASLSTLVYLAGGNLFVACGALIIAALVAASASVSLYKSSIEVDAVKLAGSLDSLVPLESIDTSIHNFSDLPAIPAANPLLIPLADSMLRLVDRIEQQTNQQLKQQEKYRSLLDSMADGLITVTENGIIETVNTAGEDLLGQGGDQLIAKHLSRFVADSACISAKSFLEKFITGSNSEPANLATDMKRIDGSSFPARLAVSKLSDSQGTHFVIVFSDISDIRSMEKQLRSVNIQLSKTNERLEKTSITDALTQLYNRRHFDSMFYKELQRATRSRTSLSLIIIDIDFFKQYNDIYGHTAGDHCIKKVAGSIKQVFKRSGDLPSRYGGEEFAIILPGCDGLELQERAETMRHAVCDLVIPHSGSKAHENLSISLGAVTYKPGAQELIAPKPKDLFSEADKALYRAKARGRNQVVFAGQYQPIQIPSGLSGMYGQLISR